MGQSHEENAKEHTKPVSHQIWVRLLPQYILLQTGFVPNHKIFKARF